MKKLIYFSFLILIFYSACHLKNDNANDKILLAKVGDESLFFSKIKGNIPIGVSMEDSVMILRSIVDNWISETLIFLSAKNDMSRKELDFGDKVDDYYRSLVIHKYEGDWIHRHLDTTVTQVEMLEYYHKNAYMFHSHEELFRLNYIVLPLDYPLKAYVRDSILTADSITISNYCKDNNLVSVLTDHWMSGKSFNQLFTFAILGITPQMELPKYFEFKNEEEIYLVKFNDYLPAHTVRPFDMVKRTVRNNIINQRQLSQRKAFHEKKMREGYDRFKVSVY